MQALGSIRSALVVAGLVVAVFAMGVPAPAAEPVLRAAVTIDGARRYQRIDGFGVNLTPAQWRGGALKPTLDLLVDDLGTSLVRLDCYGKADWLDPARRGPDGRWPEAYLAEVYRSPVFTDCWDTFRYLTAKGADVHLNVSGRIPAAWAGADGQTLVAFDAYAEMAASLARWARDEEGLRFATFAPFNETNLGFPEGPKIRDADLATAVRAVARSMDAAGLGDVKLVVACDAPAIRMERFSPMLEATDLVGRVSAFSTHTYGDGDEGDATPGWYDGQSERAALVKAVAASRHAGASVWMTEYGDLDQTGLIEWQFAWRSARRLMRMLADGFGAALAWDAFDNLHEHDGVWATYGLLKTDPSAWTYAPKKRYFAAKQVYRFVRPGWRRVEVALPPRDPKDVYAGWHDPMRHVRLLAFASPDGQDLTLVGMSRVEGDVELAVRLSGLAPEAAGKSLAYCRTTRAEDARPVEEKATAGGAVRISVPEGSIFTLTTLRTRGQ
jgi:hypothetical protein